MDITVKKNFHFTEEEITDLICSAIEGGIGYWACMDNTTDLFERYMKEYPDACYDELIYKMLFDDENNVVEFFDAEDYEDEAERWELTGDKLIKGIRMAIENDVWSGDMDDEDSCVADCIFQYALFDEIVYG